MAHHNHLSPSGPTHPKNCMSWGKGELHSNKYQVPMNMSSSSKQSESDLQKQEWLTAMTHNSTKQLVYFAACAFSSCGEHSHKKTVPREATVNCWYPTQKSVQLTGTMYVYARLRAQLHLPVQTAQEWALNWTYYFFVIVALRP